MKKLHIHTGIITILLLLFFSSCEKEIVVDPVEKRAEYRIAVVLPLNTNQKEYWEHSINWAIENLNAAQTGAEGIRLSVEWYDESTEDLHKLATELATRNDIHAIVGPLYSAHTKIFADECVDTEKPLVMMSSSAELIHAYSFDQFLWSLAETDISQCEVLLSLAMEKNAKTVSLIAGNDWYGKTFTDWIGFQAKELGMQFLTSIEYAPASLEADMRNILATEAGAIICAPSSAADAISMARIANELNAKHRCLFSDVAFDRQIIQSLGANAEGLEGVTIGNDPKSGFDVEYEVRYGEVPSLGAGHFYDAVMLIGLAAIENQRSQELTFNNSIKKVVNGSDGQADWKVFGLANAIEKIKMGTYPLLQGATGPLTFDSKVYSSVLSSVYYHWQIYNGKFLHLDYCSSDPSRRVSSTLSSWNWKTTQAQSFQDVTLTYPAREKTYALLISTATGWNNYRHQADVHSMYQLLIDNGFDPADILLIAEDDIAYNSQNPEQGVIHTSPDGKNVYIPGSVDFNLSDVSPATLESLLRGGAPLSTQGISPGSNDNLFIYWVGHGVMNGVNWGKEVITGSTVSNIISNLSTENHFRKILFMVEACYSGQLGKACEDIPGVLVMTAASDKETSKATNYDSKLALWTSNMFSNSLIQQLEADPDASIRDLYYKLYSSTMGSHVTVYNQALFDNLYTSSVTEFICP